MPTYVCYARQGLLTSDARAQIAGRISDAHSRATGAPTSFVQCIFRDLTADGHFIGKRPAPAAGVWIHGLIRAGRTTEVKIEVLIGIRDCITQVLNIRESLVWVYLSEIKHSDIIEFGNVLPDLGGDEQWINALPPDLRDHLIALG